MPRSSRVTPGGMVFHVLNRGVGRMRLFHKDAEYQALEDILQEVLAVQPMRICSYCLMPNHWHFVLWPEHDGDLPAFMQRLTVTHVTRWRRHRRQVGYGHVYQGRFKSFPIAADDHFPGRAIRRCRNLHCGPTWCNEPNCGGWSSLVAACSGDGRATPPALDLAATLSARLGEARQSSPDRSRARGDPAERDSRTAVRGRGLDREMCREAWPGLHVAASRPPANRKMTRRKRGQVHLLTSGRSRSILAACLDRRALLPAEWCSTS